MKVYAKWEDINAEKIKVSFDIGEGVGKAEPIYVEYGEKYGELPSGLTRQGYTFSGWWTGENGTGTQISADSVVAIDTEHTLFARWTDTTPLSFKTIEAGKAYEVSVSNAVTPPEDIYIPATYNGIPVTKIAERAFFTSNNSNVKLIKTVVIEEGIKTIGAWAFRDCSSLTSIVIPKSVTSIGESAFRDCSSLLTITLPISVTSIGDWAFRDCNSLTIYCQATAKVAGWHNGWNYSGRPVVWGYVEKYVTVSFDLNGGEGNTVSLNLKVDDRYSTLPSNISREGHSFGGWYLSLDFEGEKITNESFVTKSSDHTLYAKWIPISDILVTFEAYDGIGAYDDKKVTYLAAYGELPTVYKTGYDFEGWYNGENGEGDKVVASTVVTSYTAHTLYAKWTPKSTIWVSFESHGAGEVEDIKVTYDTNYGSLPAGIGLTKYGYTFGGWWTGENGSGIRITNGSTVTVDVAHTLYAKWIPISNIPVSFDTLGASGNASSISVSYGEAYSNLPADLEKPGYDFKGWYTDSVSGIKIDNSSIVTTIVAHTLYARWSAKKIQVDFESGTLELVDSIVCDYDSVYGMLPALQTRLGYTFAGWWTSSNGGTRITSGSLVRIDTAHTLYARWDAVGNILVSFESNGAEEYYDNIFVTFAGGYGDLPQAQRVGYEFVAWYLNKGLTEGSRVTDSTVVSTIVAHTLYAKWTPISGIIVSFETYTTTKEIISGEEGDEIIESPVIIEPIIVTYDDMYGTLPEGFTKDGYVFAGWYLGENATGARVTDISLVKQTKNHTLYAKWNVVDKTVVSFETFTDAYLSDIIVTFGEDYKTLPDLQRYGYSFEGWYLNKNFTGDKVEGTTKVGVSESHTLYAKWLATTDIIVSFELNNKEEYEQVLSVTFDEAYGELPKPERIGYTFNGWWTSNGIQISESSLVKTAEEHTLHAKWIANNIIVSFDGTDIKKQVQYESLYGELLIPIQIYGYRFEGWMDADGVRIYESSVVRNPLEHSLFPIYLPISGIPVELKSVGGSLPVGSIFVTYNNSYSGLPTPTKIGYVFDGWWTLENGEGVKITENSVVTIETSHTLYANWKALIFTVSFEKYSGEGQAEDIFVTFDQSYGTLPILEKKSHIFEGWWTGVGGTGTRVYENTLVTTANSHVLYAKWIKSESDDHSIEASSEYEIGNDTVSVNVANSVTEYDFNQVIKVSEGATWTVCYDEYGIVKVLSKKIPLTEGDNVVYIFVVSESGNGMSMYTVRVRRNYMYTVTFVGKNEQAHAVNKVEENSLITPIATAPTKEGYDFGGWDYNFSDPITKDIAIYPIWTAKTYTVMLDYRGGSGLSEAEVVYGHTFNLPIPTAPKENAVFGGWYSYVGVNSKGTQMTNQNGNSLATTYNYTSGMIVYAYWLGYDDLHYSLNSGNYYTVDKGSSTLSSIVIPQNYEGIPVKEIGSFIGYESLVSIVIPNTIENIWVGAFRNCNNLTNISLPFIGANRNSSNDGYAKVFGFIFGYTITSAQGALLSSVVPTPVSPSGTTYQFYVQTGTNGFYRAYNFYHYYIPASLRSVTLTGGNEVYYNAFFNCSGLTSVTLFENTSYIRESAFENCWGLKEMVIPNSVSSIGSAAFKGCNNLTSMSLPFTGSSMSGSGSYAVFGYIFGFTTKTSTSNYSETYPPVYADQTFQYYTYNYNSETSTYSYTWYYYYIPKTLRTVSLTSGTEVKERAFYDCSFLTTINLPDTLKYIRKSAFDRCSALKQIYLPNSVTSMEDYAFWGATSLTSINIPENLVSMGKNVFERCESINLVDYNAKNLGNFTSSVTLFPSTNTNLHVIIGSKVERIPNYIFYRSSNSPVSSVVFDEGSVCLEIGAFSFYYANKLQEIILPNSIRTIGHSAFDKCYSLKNIVLPEGLNEIGQSAFKLNTSLESIIIPTTVTVMRSAVFEDCYLLSIYLVTNPYQGWHQDWNYRGASVYYYSETPIVGYWYYLDSKPTLWRNSNGKCTDCGLDEAECICEARINYVRVGEGYMVVGRDSSSSSLVIPQTYEGLPVVEIAEHAFSNDNNLVKVVIPNTVNRIREAAFRGCNSLTSITLPFTGETRDSRNERGVLGFIFGYTTDSSGIPNSPPGTILGPTDDRVFQWHFGYGGGAIQGAYYYFIPKSLRHVELTGLAYNEIKKRAFFNCYMLTSIKLPKSVDIGFIRESAFDRCINLVNLVIPSGVREIEENAFWGMTGLNSLILPRTVEIIRRAFENTLNVTVYLEEGIKAWRSDAWKGQAPLGWPSCTLSEDKTYVVRLHKSSYQNDTRVPYREGYKFAGWYTNEIFESYRYQTLADAPNTMLFAKWELL